jgi:hypothetical protein
MGKSDKTKDEGIIGDRKANEHIAEKECCADTVCCWNTDVHSGVRSVEGNKGGA